MTMAAPITLPPGRYYLASFVTGGSPQFWGAEDRIGMMTSQQGISAGNNMTAGTDGFVASVGHSGAMPSTFVVQMAAAEALGSITFSLRKGL